MSASAKTASASGRIAAPSPAPAWTTTSWPWSASSRAPDGVSATRYSSVLISVGTPTFTSDLARSGVGGVGLGSSRLGRLGAADRIDDLASAQGEPELDAVTGGA